MAPSSFSPTFNKARRSGSASLLLTAAAALVYPAPGLSALLEYDRLALHGGELWRLLTCHWTHVSFEHLLWDALTFLFLGAACERRNRPRFLAAVVCSAIVIPLSVRLALPGLRYYRGLSGIDSALFALLAVLFLREKAQSRGLRRSVVVIFFTAFLGKIGFEAITGMTVFVDNAGTGMVPVPLAHLVGAAAGILSGTVALPLPKRDGPARPLHPHCHLRETMRQS